MNSRSVAERAEWDAAAARLPGSHVLQSWTWGECKSRFGWTADRRLWTDRDGRTVAAAQILRRTARVGPFSATLFYLPKGPLLDWDDDAVREPVLADLEQMARREHAIQIKIDPDLVMGRGIPEAGKEDAEAAGARALARLRDRGWRFSPEQVQFRNTVLLDIRPGEDALLAAMKSKTRYNIRLAARHGVTVRPGGESDLPQLYRMYAETADRDSFVIRPEGYYLDIWGSMMRAGHAQPLIAEVEELPVAALILFHFADRGWYLYGMSRSLHRGKMPNHLLQWEAVRWLKRAGYSFYDLWGAPDVFAEDDPLWGVFQFKQGFGGQVVRYAGAWDHPSAPARYAAYHRILPRLLGLTRLLARRRTHRVADTTRGLP
jgi:peptidoglycan pentaglycine glycine transferase (the first glycine)